MYRANVIFEDGEIERISPKGSEYWVHISDLVVWIVPCVLIDMNVYSSSDNMDVIYQLQSGEYYKGVLLDIEDSRVCLQIESTDGSHIVTGWVDRTSCLCSSANGEC